MKKLIVLVITLTVLLVGCGSSSSKPSSEPPSNPTVTTIAAQPSPNFLTHNGNIGKAVLYIKVTNVTTACTVTLTGMTDSADLIGYPDETFATGAVSSTNSGGFDRTILRLEPNGSNEMFIKIDASSTTAGTEFTLTLQDT